MNLVFKINLRPMETRAVLEWSVCMPHFVHLIPWGFSYWVAFTGEVRFDGNWNSILAEDETEYISYLFICLGVDTYRDEFEFQCNPQIVYYVVLISTATSDYKRKKNPPVGFKSLCHLSWCLPFVHCKEVLQAAWWASRVFQPFMLFLLSVSLLCCLFKWSSMWVFFFTRTMQILWSFPSFAQPSSFGFGTFFLYRTWNNSLCSKVFTRNRSPRSIPARGTVCFPAHSSLGS